MAEIGGYVGVASSNAYFFTNTACNDMLIYPETSNQRILLGTRSNAACVVVVNSNNLAIAGDISFTGSLLQNGVPYSSGVGFSNSGSNLFIVGSNIAIGVSNPVEQFQVRTGNARFDCNIYVFSNIGVGKSNPAYSIDTTGDINFGGILRQNGTAYVGSQWSNNGSNIFVLGSNIGIYTQTPSEAIDVRGSNMKVGCNMYVMSNLGVGKSNPAYSIDTSGDINFGGVLRQGGVPYIGSQWSNNTSNLFILGSNVGIATQTPSEAFHVARSNAKFDCNVYVMSNIAVGKSNPLAMLDVRGSVIFGSNMALSNASGAVALTSSGGNLGIGTTAPLESLCLVGSNMSISNDSGKTVITSSNGNMGINNSNPLTTLDIIGTTSFRGNVQMNGAVGIRGLTISKRDGTMANITTSSVAGFSNDTVGNVLSVASNNSNYSFRFLGGSTEVASLRGDGLMRLQCANIDNLLGKQYPGRIADGAGSTGFENAGAADFGASNLFGGVALCNLTPFSWAPEGSVYFPGTAGSYAVLGRAGSLAAPSNLLPSFTAEGWFYYTANPTAAQVGQGSAAGTPLWAFGNSNGLLGLWNTFGSTAYVAGGALAQSNWTHVAATYTGSSTKNVQLFINGALQSLTVSGAATSTGSTATLTNALVGGGQDLFLGQTGGVATAMYVSGLRIVHNAVLYASNFVPSGPPGVAPIGNTRALLRAPLPTVTTASNTVNNLDSVAVHCIPNDYAFFMDMNGASMPNAAAGFAPTFDSNVTNSVVFNRAQSNMVSFAPTHFNIATRGFTVLSEFQFTGCNLGSNERIIDLGNGAPGSNIILRRDALGSNLVFTVYNGASAVSLRSSTFLNQNTPYVVAARYEPYGSNMSIWINGAPSSNNGPVGLGFDRMCLSNMVGRSAWATDSNLSANVTTLAIYNRALTDKEIADASAALLTSPGLRAGSSLDVGAGLSCGPALSVRRDGTVAVNSLVGNNSTGVFPVDYGMSNLNVAGAVLGSVPFVEQGPFAGEGSMCFNGAASNAVGMYSPMFGTSWWTGGGFTCECWVNYGSFANVVGAASSIPKTIGAVTYSGSSAANYWNLGALSSGLLSFFYWTGAYQNVTGTTVISLNTWHHIAVSYDGTTIRLFLDGNLENSAAVSGTPQLLTNVITIGWVNDVANCITAYVANPRLVYGSAIYTAAFVPPSGPVGAHTSGRTALAIMVQRDPGRVLVPKLGGSGMVRAYPPVQLTGYYTNVQNSAYGRGGYVVTASSDLANGTYYAWYLFNNFNLLWVTGDTYNNTTGAYTGSTSTSDINGYPFTGEWVQIQLPVSIVLTSFTLSSQNGTLVNMPASIAVLGSLDGIRWVLLKQQPYTAWVAQVPTSFYVGATQAFPYYRLVCTSKMPAGGVNQLIAIDEWLLYGGQESAVFSADGQVGIGVSRPIQQLEVAGNAVVYGSISAGNMGMFRNRVINGDMRFDQRNAGATFSSPNNVYTLDRWAFYNGSAATAACTVQQTALPAPLPGFRSCLKVTLTAALTVPSPFILSMQQPIEGHNIADLNWGTGIASPATVSFYVYTSVASTYTMFLMNGTGFTGANGGTMSFVSPFTIAAANSWQRVVVNVPGPTTGTFNSGNTNGICLGISMVQQGGINGSTYATANAWQSGNNFSTGPITAFTPNGSVFCVTGVQLEKGTIATPFEFRPYPVELQLCQRYCYRTYGFPASATATVPFIASGALWTATQAIFYMPLPVSMRDDQSFVSSGTFQLVTLGGNMTITGLNKVDGNAVNAVRIDATLTGTPTAIGAVTFLRGANQNSYVALTCEL